MASYVHPVVAALEELDRGAEDYQEQRVRLINKHTHTIDPVIDVDSSEEEDEKSGEELEQFERGMAGMLSELSKESCFPFFLFLSSPLTCCEQRARPSHCRQQLDRRRPSRT